MSKKRVKPSVGTLYVDWLCEAHPDLKGTAPIDSEGCDRLAAKALERMEQRNPDFGHMDDSLLAYMDAYGMVVSSVVVQMCGKWRRCPHVFDFDPAFASEIGQSEGMDAVPSEILLKLPYDIVYVSVRTHGIEGFYAWLGADAHGETRLRLCLLKRLGFSEEDLSFMKSSLDGPVPEFVHTCESIPLVEGVTLSGHLSDGTFERSAAFSKAYGAYSFALSLLAYICSENADVETVYIPPADARKHRKKGRRPNPETVHRAGAHVGRALGEARKAYQASEGEGHGSRCAPYVRAAHWHHYWTGKRKGRTDGRFGDQLVLRWIPPTFVGAGEPDEVQHKVPSAD